MLPPKPPLITSCIIFLFMIALFACAGNAFAESSVVVQTKITITLPNTFIQYLNNLRKEAAQTKTIQAPSSVSTSTLADTTSVVVPEK
jgi:hypothetical protein